MKKTIISIIGIALMLLAITACKPNYVVVPPIFDKPSGEVQTGTPVETLDELKDVLASGREARLTKELYLNTEDLLGMSGIINGADNTINLLSTEPLGEDQAVALRLNNGLSLKNVKIDASNVVQTRAAAEPFVILVQGEGSTLENVKITTGSKVAGINVHTATGVTLKNIEFTDEPLKAPINISSSTVTIDGLTAVGSDWYGDQNIIQINGVGGSPAHKASTVMFVSAEGIDGVWMEAVESPYSSDAGITNDNYGDEGQSKVIGLDGFIPVFSNQPGKETKGWMFTSKENAATLLTAFFMNPAHERFFNRLNGFEDSTFAVTAPTSISEKISYSLNLAGYSYNKEKTATATGSLTASFYGKVSEEKLNAEKWILDGSDIELTYTDADNNTTSVIVVSFDEFSGIISTGALGTEQKTAIFSGADGSIKVENPDAAKFSFAGELSGSATINGVVFTAADISSMLGAFGN